MTDIIVYQVVRKYAQRSAVGIHKYRTTLQENNRDNYLQHLQEELMDATLYIEKLMSLEMELTHLVKTYPNDSELGEKIREMVK